MKIIIRTKGSVKMSDSVKDYINNQVMELDKLFNQSENVNVNVLCTEKNQKYRTEITIVLKYVILRSECNGDTLYASINLAVDKIEQQLIRHKKKVNDFIRKRDGIAQYFVEKEKEVEEEEPKIRVKKIDTMEMTVDEAITQMELLDHEFFMFKNEETHTIAVVYKRKNGGYGLIESIE